MITLLTLMLLGRSSCVLLGLADPFLVSPAQPPPLFLLCFSAAFELFLDALGNSRRAFLRRFPFPEVHVSLLFEPILAEEVELCVRVGLRAHDGFSWRWPSWAASLHTALHWWGRWPSLVLELFAFGTVRCLQSLLGLLKLHVLMPT